MRRHYASYLKGLSHVKEFRNKLVVTEDPAELERIFCEVEEYYMNQMELA
jgi:tRNA-dihydrouridine synthase B